LKRHSDVLAEQAVAAAPPVDSASLATPSQSIPFTSEFGLVCGVGGLVLAGVVAKKFYRRQRAEYESIVGDELP